MTQTPIQKRTKVEESRLKLKTAFVSIPAKITAQVKPAVILKALQPHFPNVKFASFANFASTKTYQTKIGETLGTVDGLIVVCDSTRVIGSGIVREINEARRQKRRVFIFKLDEKQHRPYYGYTPCSGGARLNTRAEAKGRTQHAAAPMLRPQRSETV